MASDAAQLVVRLEAKLDQFERQLKQAGVIADQQAGEIEGRFSRANLAVSTGIGSALGRIAGDAPSKIINLVQDLVERFKELRETAKVTGLALEEVFALQRAGAEKDIAPEEVNKSLSNLGSLLDRARRGEDNGLAKLFSANGDDVKQAKDISDAMEKVSGYVQNARTEFQKIEIAQAAGFSRDWVAILERGPEALRASRDASAAVAPELQHLAKLADDFENAWKAATTAIKNYFLENFGALRTEIANFVANTAAELQKLHDAASGLTKMLGLGGISNDGQLAQWAKSLSDAADAIRPKPETAGPPMPTAAQRRQLDGNEPGQGTSTRDPNRPLSNAPPVAKGGGGGGGTEKLDSFEREERRATENAARIDAETRSLGLNTFERTKASEALRLEQMLVREGIPLSDAYRERIDLASYAYAKSVAANEQARQAQRESLQLQSFAGTELVNALDGAILRGEKLSDVFADVAQAISRAALQAAIMGTGPLAGLFGTASNTPGQTGGLIGGLVGLFGGIGKNAAGTDYWRGGPTWVGENGPEIVNLPRGAQVVPNAVATRGGGGVTQHVNLTIDVAGATGNQEVMTMVQRGVQAGLAQVPRIASAVVRDRGRSW